MTIYVATTGNNGNPGTEASPKLTIAGAVSIATTGDTIHVGAGTYDEAIDLASAGKSLRFEGVGRGLTVVQNASTPFTATSRPACSWRKMTILTTAFGAGPEAGIAAPFATDLLVEDCDVTGHANGINVALGRNVTIRNSDVSGHGDGVVLTNVTGFLIENGTVTSDSTYPGDVETRAVAAGGTSGGVIRNAVLNNTRDGSSAASKTVALLAGRDVRLEGVALVAIVSGLTSVSSPSCLYSTSGANAATILDGVRFQTSVEGSGTARHADSTAPIFDGLSNLDPTKITGGGGIVRPGIDWNRLANPTATQTLTNTSFAGSVAGAGARQCTQTISDTGQPIADAEVWVTTDAGGDNIFAGTLVTDADGHVTFLLNAGATYYLWAQKENFNGIQGDAFVAVPD